jgi:hypothetical protein
MLFLITGLLFTTTNGFSQKIRTETFAVPGNCDICKTKIEKAAKKAGAYAARWDKQTQVLQVRYNVNQSSLARMQQLIAAAGYDTPLFKSTVGAYKALDECCQYQRTNRMQNCCNKACEGNEQACMEKCKGEMACEKMKTSMSKMPGKSCANVTAAACCKKG